MFVVLYKHADLLESVVTFIAPLMLLGDLNLDMPGDPLSAKFISLLDIYSLKQMIYSPTHSTRDRTFMFYTYASNHPGFSQIILLLLLLYVVLTGTIIQGQAALKVAHGVNSAIDGVFRPSARRNGHPVPRTLCQRPLLDL